MAESSTEIQLNKTIAELRDSLRDRFAEVNHETRAYYPESGERDEHDHYAVVALTVFQPFIERLVELEAIGGDLHQALSELRTGNEGEYEPLSLPMITYDALDKWSALSPSPSTVCDL